MQREFLALVSLHHGMHNKTGASLSGSGYYAAKLSACELLDHILAGKAWVGCMLESGHRCEEAAGPSNLIVLDIDGDITLEEFWAKPFVERHCLVTVTSCSHLQVTDKNPEAKERVRAVFTCDEHSDIPLHAAIYHLMLSLMGLTLADNSGEKPERLWYGNDHAEVRFGSGEKLPWDLIEAARDLKSQQEISQAVAADTVIDDNDLARCDYVLRNLLPASAHGGGDLGYNDYWQVVLNAAASAGDVLHDAFQQWSSQGDHGKEERLNRRRWHGAGKRSNPVKILALARKFLGEGWWRQLPEHLWYGRSGTAAKPPPISLASSRSVRDTLPPQAFGGLSSFSGEDVAVVPSVVPAAAELQRLAKAAQPLVLATSSAAAAKASEPAELTLEDKLSQLYMLRAHGLLQEGQDLRLLASHEIAVKDREILGEILRHPGYCNQPSEVERDLITHFRSEHQLLRNTTAPVKSFKLDGFGRKQVKWLIPNFLLVGRDHVLYAKGGVGKTTLALHMVRAISGDPEISEFLDSGSFSNHHLWRRNPILFIGTDMFGSAEEVTNTSLQLFGMAGKDFLKQVDWWLEDEEEKTAPWELSLKDLTRLHDYLQGHHHAGTPVAAVFIDSMKAVCPDHLLVGQQGFKDYIKLTADLCARYGAALIWIHHARGDGAGAQGIQRITEASAANFHLKRDDKTKQITLEVEKIRGGAKARTLLLSSLFSKSAPRVMANPDDSSDPGDETSAKVNLVLDVLQEHFKQYRITNLGMSAESLERTYLGMKIGEIEKTLQSKYRYQMRGLSRRSLATILADLKAAGRIAGKGSYRIPPHFQPELADQPDFELDEHPEAVDLPGWS